MEISRRFPVGGFSGGQTDLQMRPKKDTILGLQEQDCNNFPVSI